MLYSSSETVVQRRFDAYNDHDIEAFMANYGLGILVFEFPLGILLTVGQEALRLKHEVFLSEGKPNMTLTERIVTGNIVIDHECGTAAGYKDWKAATIYEVAQGLIQRVWLIKA